MLPKILLTVCILALSLMFILWDLIAAPSALPSAPDPQVKEIAITPKPFIFQTLEGKTISSESLKGKIIVLNFWASWCTPCLVEFPDLIKLTEKYPQDVIFLALSVDKDIEKAKDFLKKFTPQENRIVGHDSEKRIAHDIFQTTMFPETYILGRDLTIRRHIVGVIDWTGAQSKADLETLIAQSTENP